MKIYQELARAVAARKNCLTTGNLVWDGKWTDRIECIVKDCFPHGSGFDSGTEIDLENSTGEKLVLKTYFHHMNEAGFYDGWTDHEVIVTPSLQFGFHVRVTGRDRNEIKDYIAEQFHFVLDSEVPAEYRK